MFADVVELVDTYALGAYALGREGSSPFIRTTRTYEENRPAGRFFVVCNVMCFKHKQYNIA